jgi:RNA polymerase sigma factor (sigma-70 family)
MAAEQNRLALWQIDRLFQGGSVTGLDEGQLLERFVADRDESTLEALIDRHGPMVLGVCRRVLANPADVDDAFQATFLILVRKARALRDAHRLGSWLHRVAYRVAVRARADAVRRRSLEQQGARPECAAEAQAPDRQAAQAELRAVVDQEIGRLSAIHRAAVVLCDLEGRSQQDAAQLLGWSEGALRGRLARARQKLRHRLERRGVAPAVLPVGAALFSDAAMLRVPPALVGATTRASVATLLAGRAAPSATIVISASVSALVQGVIRAMTLSKVKMLATACLLAAVGLLAVGGLVRAGLSRGEAGTAPSPMAVFGVQDGGPTAKATTRKTEPRTLQLRVVQRSDQGPISGATVEVSWLGAGSRSETTHATDTQGRCTIGLPDRAASFSISIAKDGFVPVFQSWNNRDGDLALPPTLTQELEPGQPIGGFVRDEQGRPVVGADVTVAIGQGRDDVPDTDVPAPGNMGVYAAYPHIRIKTDAQGRWRCSILPANADPGTRLWFFVEHPDHVSDTGGYSRRLSLATARAMTGALIMSSGANVSGQVRDGATKVVAGARVVLAYSGSSGDCLRTTTDPEGHFRFPHAHNRNGLGRWSVSVEAAGFAPAWQMIVPTGQIPPLDFRLIPAKAFRGRVVDSKGKPIAGASIKARWQECYHLDWKAQTDADGRFVWADGPIDGEIAFNVRREGFLAAMDREISATVGEIAITMNPLIRVRGTVVDAESGQAIPRFRIVPGESLQSDRIFWRRRWNEATANGGRFDVSPFFMDQPGTAFFVRVEADGYGPVISRAIRPGESDVTLELKLKKAVGPSGFVRTASGSPAVGADVYLNSPNYGLPLRNNRHEPPPSKGFWTTTDDKGHFTFAPQDEPVGVLVIHRDGVAQKSAEDLARSSGITLEPFGRIEGILRIGAMPGAGQPIHVWLNRMGYSHDSQVVCNYTTETDNQGRFVIDKVLPGEATVSRASSARANGPQRNAAPPVDVIPGQTVQVEIGGQGRPVTGRVTLAEASPTRIDLATAMGNLMTDQEKIPLPEGFRTWDVQKRQEWQLSPEGKARRRAHRFYNVPIGPDGRFRIEDVVPGSYKLTVSFHSPPGFQGPATGGNQVSGRVVRPVVIDPIPGGRSDEPIDVGTLELTLEVENQRPIAIGQAAPALEFKTLDGKLARLADFRGRFVLLDFWATWCGPCLEQEPHLRAVQEAFGSDNRFVLISLSLDESIEVPKSYAAKHGLKWFQGYLGQDARGTKDYGIATIPQIMLIGPDGNVLAKDLRGLGIRTMVSQALERRP